MYIHRIPILFSFPSNCIYVAVCLAFHTYYILTIKNTPNHYQFELNLDVEKSLLLTPIYYISICTMYIYCIFIIYNVREMLCWIKKEKEQSIDAVYWFSHIITKLLLILDKSSMRNHSHQINKYIYIREANIFFKVLQPF